jgi:hypothetical protein
MAVSERYCAEHHKNTEFRVVFTKKSFFELLIFFEPNKVQNPRNFINHQACEKSGRGSVPDPIPS